MKKILSLLLSLGVMTSVLAGCSGGSDNTDKKAFNLDEDITVISREDGSGTRGAFIELMGIEEKGSDGTKVDKTTKEADVVSKTDLVLTKVASDEYSIGYISLGSLKDTVKALKVNGTEASAENIKNGSYKVSRPFNIATKGDVSEVTKDFIDFILSKEGQEVVSNGYIKINDNAEAYAGNKPSGKIVVAGSSSVNPIMEKLKEAYLKINTNATIEIQASDSTAGMTGAIEGTCDIGMASRELKDSEKASLTATPIALDGIAVIVNTKNTIDDITSENIKNIYIGEFTTWSDVAK